MFDRDLWQEILVALKKNRMRTLLTAFGVFWGILMLIIMLGAGKGLSNGVTKGMGEFATNSVFFFIQRTSMPYKGHPGGRWIDFNNSDTKYLRDNIKEIDLLAPGLRVEFWTGQGQNVIVHEEKKGSFEISGEYPDIFKIDPLDMTKGRYINSYDLLQKRKVVLLGKGVVGSLFNKDEDPINKYVQIKGVYFRVIGIFESKHTGGWGEEQNKSAILPFTTMQRVYNYGGKVHQYAMTAKKGISASVLQDKVLLTIKQRHEADPNDPQAVGSFNLEKQVKQFNAMFLGIAILIWIVGTGTLLAGVIGVSNIMLVIIRERTHEIGIQRAIGASPYQIIRQIVMESVFITTVAGYTGLVLGVGIVEGINFALVKTGANTGMFSRPEINFSVAITALTILIISGIIAGIIPAKRAINIKPVNALRYEN